MYGVQKKHHSVKRDLCVVSKETCVYGKKPTHVSYLLKRALFDYTPEPSTETFWRQNTLYCQKRPAYIERDLFMRLLYFLMTPESRQNRLFNVKRDFSVSKEACVHRKRPIHETSVSFDDTRESSKQTF